MCFVLSRYPIITKIVKDSPASKVPGLIVGNSIVSIDGIHLKDVVGEYVHELVTHLSFCLPWLLFGSNVWCAHPPSNH
jgi:hypothetical protein